MPRRSRSDLLKTLTLAGAICLALVLNKGEAHARDLQATVPAGGCAWCAVADFDGVPGAIEGVSGFAGG